MPAWYLVAVVIEVAIAGLGAWSDLFGDVPQLLSGMEQGDWLDGPLLAPALIPPRERRRAPKTVKLAIEAMSQACEQSGLPADDLAVVTASSMGDMEITDTMCRTLAAHPQLVSPTTFHNSVHNAAVGYWSISQKSHAACNAVSAGEYSGTAGLLEAAALCQDSDCPVLFAVYEGLAPDTLLPLCRSPHPLALACMLVPSGMKLATLQTLSITTRDEIVQWPALPASLAEPFGQSPAGRILPLFVALANRQAANSPMKLPLSPHGSLELNFGRSHQPGSVRP